MWGFDVRQEKGIIFVRNFQIDFGRKRYPTKFVPPSLSLRVNRPEGETDLTSTPASLVTYLFNYLLTYLLTYLFTYYLFTYLLIYLLTYSVEQNPS
jgi:hypothetical protein